MGVGAEAQPGLEQEAKKVSEIDESSVNCCEKPGHSRPVKTFVTVYFDLRPASKTLAKWLDDY